MYPTAGGLYYWAYRPAQRLGRLTAWLNMTAITITAGIDFAAAIYLVGLWTQFFGLDPNSVAIFGLKYTDYYFYFLVMILLMIPQVLLNIAGIRIVHLLNDFSVWWHIGGVAIIALLLTFFGQHHNDLGFLFSFVNVVNPLDASSATLADGSTAALIIDRYVCLAPCRQILGCHSVPGCCLCLSLVWACCKHSGLILVMTPRLISKKLTWPK
jgi:amino acid transporter